MFLWAFEVEASPDSGAFQQKLETEVVQGACRLNRLRLLKT